ncbi:hypothetical protein WJX79_004260 [Trebouxia sp. C0005]
MKGEMTKLNQSGRHDKRQAQKLRLELQQAKQLIKKLHSDQEGSLEPSSDAEASTSSDSGPAVPRSISAEALHRPDTSGAVSGAFVILLAQDADSAWTFKVRQVSLWLGRLVQVSGTSCKLHYFTQCSSSKLQFMPAVDSRGYPVKGNCALEDVGLVAVFAGLVSPQPGGVGSIPKPLAKTIAQTLGSGMEGGAAAKPQSSLEMVPEGSEDDDG